MTNNPTDDELTEAFRSMNGRDKWGAIVLTGLVGTDEPWVKSLTDTLRDEATTLIEYRQQVQDLKDANKRLELELADLWRRCRTLTNANATLRRRAYPLTKESRV